MVLLNFSVLSGNKSAAHSLQPLCLLFAPTGCRAMVKWALGPRLSFVLLATVIQTT